MKYLILLSFIITTSCTSISVNTPYSVRSPGCDRFATFEGKDFKPIDKQNMDFAAKRCKIMKPLSPCIVKFVKLAEREYYAECGRDRKRK